MSEFFRGFLFAALFFTLWTYTAASHHGDTEERRFDAGFLLRNPQSAVSADAGEVVTWGADESRFLGQDRVIASVVTLKPSATLLPLYANFHVILYTLEGKGRLGMLGNNTHVERNLQRGDVFAVPHAHLTYLINTQSTADLKVFAMGKLPKHHGDRGGEGENATSHQVFLAARALKAFSKDLLAQAFKSDSEEVHSVLQDQPQDPIVRLGSAQPSSFEGPDVSQLLDDKGDAPGAKSWQSMSSDWICSDWPWASHICTAIKGVRELPSIFQSRPYNVESEILHDASGTAGWATTVTYSKLSILRLADMGALAVKLKEGALLLPHWNGASSEVLLVTQGHGRIQIAFPNGTSALDADVEPGDLVVVPRHHPVAQRAESAHPLEFVGFTTGTASTPEFLAGSNSVLRSVPDDVLGAAFGVSGNKIRGFLQRQSGSVLIPGGAQSDSWTLNVPHTQHQQQQ